MISFIFRAVLAHLAAPLLDLCCSYFLPNPRPDTVFFTWMLKFHSRLGKKSEYLCDSVSSSGTFNVDDEASEGHTANEAIVSFEAVVPTLCDVVVRGEPYIRRKRVRVRALLVRHVEVKAAALHRLLLRRRQRYGPRLPALHRRRFLFGSHHFTADCVIFGNDRWQKPVSQRRRRCRRRRRRRRRRLVLLPPPPRRDDQLVKIRAAGRGSRNPHNDGNDCKTKIQGKVVCYLD